MRFLLLVPVYLIVYLWTLGSEVYAIDGDPKKLGTYIKNYIDQNYDLVDQFPVYNEVRNRVSEKIVEYDISQTAERQYLKDLMFYNNTNILRVVKYITSREGAYKRFSIWKENEIQELLKKENEVKSQIGLGNTSVYLNTENEFSRNGEVYRVNFSDSAYISDTVQNTSIANSRYIFYKEDVGFIGDNTPKVERKISFKEIIESGDKKFLFYSDNYFEKSGSFYTYEYDEYFTINSNYGVYKSDVESSGNSFESAIFLRLQDAKNNIVFFPKNRKLMNKDFLGTITQEDKDFINLSTQDVLKTNKDYSDELKQIYQLGKEIVTNSSTQDEKILSIYNWMVKNISYPTEYDLSSTSLFSGIETYKNGYGLCEGQAHLMYYLLKSAGIKDVEIITGYVVDSQDFPLVGHAWIQIEDKFYDPSFERVYHSDSSKYLYYNLPYDIAYTNRYNIRDIPEKVFEVSLERRQQEVSRRRYNLTEKYPSGKYAVLNKYSARKEYSQNANTSVKLDDIYDSINTYDVYIENGRLTSPLENFNPRIEYYAIPTKSSPIEDILEDIDYNINDYVIINIYEDDQLIEYGITDSYLLID